MSKKCENPVAPYFYIGLVLKGTEEQYLHLLKYLGGHSGCDVIYQCKSLTYLRVVREDGVKIQAVPRVLSFKAESQEVVSR